jgi:hypothetical protein
LSPPLAEPPVFVVPPVSEVPPALEPPLSEPPNPSDVLPPSFKPPKPPVSAMFEPPLPFDEPPELAVAPPLWSPGFAPAPMSPLSNDSISLLGISPPVAHPATKHPSHIERTPSVRSTRALANPRRACVFEPS